MAKSFGADLRAFNEKALRNTGLVVADAAQGVMADATQDQPSISETGTFEIGKVPVDEGELIGNTSFELNGSISATGTPSSSTPADYALGLAGFELGDVAQFNFHSAHALPMENGTASISGRFFVREAVNGAGGWQSRINGSARKIGS